MSCEALRSCWLVRGVGQLEVPPAATAQYWRTYSNFRWSGFILVLGVRGRWWVARFFVLTVAPALAIGARGDSGFAGTVTSQAHVIS